MLDTCSAGATESEPLPELIAHWWPSGLLAHVQLNDPNRRAPGQGALRFGNQLLALCGGDMASEPCWLVRKSRNRSATEHLVLTAITDFGLTSSVLGDVDRRTRLKADGADAFSGPGTAAAPQP